MKQKEIIGKLDAIEAHLLESIVEMKRVSSDSLKKGIETRLVEKTNLLKINTNLKKQVAKLSFDFAAMTKSVHMLNSCTSNLIHVPYSSHRGLGFHSSSNTPQKIEFASPAKPEEEMSQKMSPPRLQTSSNQDDLYSVRPKWRCHHCGK